jgi:hypothetical protein
MALSLSLESTGPGRGLLRVGGFDDLAESVNLAIQRNDGRYLGLQGQWQPAPHWHPQFSAEPQPRGLRLALGPELMDSIIAMQGAPLRVSVRLDDQEDSGILRIRGSLIGSDAAADERTLIMAHGRWAQPKAPEADPPAMADPRSARQDGDLLGPDGPQTGGAPKSPPVRRRRVGLWLVVLGLPVLLGAGLVIRELGWFDASVGGTEPAVQPVGGVATSPGSDLTGLAFAADFLAKKPAADAVLAQAKASAQAGDCDAALLLYDQAAELDAALGVGIARLFDPASFVAGGCIDAASEDNALEYYLGAAEAGAPDAMQRAGEILIRRADSGPLHEQGMELLRRARTSAAGR